MKTNKPAEIPQTKPCRKYFKKLDRICGDKYGYFKNEKRNYIKKKTDFDLWICPTCEKIKDKPAEISLSDLKIKEGFGESDFWYHYREEDIKEAVKKILERIDKAVYKWMKDLGIFESAESVNIPDVLDLEKEIIDIIKSEMGERIVKE